MTCHGRKSLKFNFMTFHMPWGGNSAIVIVGICFTWHQPGYHIIISSLEQIFFQHWMQLKLTAGKIHKTVQFSAAVSILTIECWSDSSLGQTMSPINFVGFSIVTDCFKIFLITHHFCIHSCLTFIKVCKTAMYSVHTNYCYKAKIPQILDIRLNITYDKWQCKSNVAAQNAEGCCSCTLIGWKPCSRDQRRSSHAYRTRQPIEQLTSMNEPVVQIFTYLMQTLIHGTLCHVT